MATCWTYNHTVAAANGYPFFGYHVTTDQWFAKAPADRILTDAAFGANKIDTGDTYADYYKKWACQGLDTLNSPIESDTRLAAICQKVVPGPNEATATDPSYTLGEMQFLVYNSSRTVAQDALSRQLTQA